MNVMRKTFLTLFLMLFAFAQIASATVSDTTTPRKLYSGNSLTVAFPITFPYEIAADVIVLHTAADGAETTWVLDGAGDTGYTIASSTVTANTAPATGTTLLLYREIPLTQLVDLRQNRRFNAETEENVFDKLTLAIQDNNEKLGRTLGLPITSNYTDLTLPDPINENFLRWKSDLSGLENRALSAVPLNLPVFQLSSYADLAAAVASLGAVTKYELWIDQDDSSNATVTKNITLRFINGNTLSGTVEIYSLKNIIAFPYQQLFDITSTITLTASGGIASPDMWTENATEGTTEMAAAVQACFTAAENKALIVFETTTLISTKITLPTTGCLAEGRTGVGYFNNSPRGRFHIVNGVTSSSDALFHLPNTTKGTACFRWLAIDNNAEQSMVFETEAGAGGTAGVLSLSFVSMTDCGGDGVVINTNAGTSSLHYVVIRGLDSATVEDGTGIAAGSIGLLMDAADSKVSYTIIEKFATGLKTASTHCNITNNIFDQNLVNVLEIGTSNIFTGNRIQYGYTEGMQLGDGTGASQVPVITGNEFTRNNTTKSKTTGTYDGSGLLCFDLSNGTIGNNSFAEQDIGIEIVDAAGGSMQGNTWRLLDTGLFDYSSNVGTGRILLTESNDIFAIKGTNKESGIAFVTGYLNITGGIFSSDPPSLGRAATNQLADDVTINIEDSNFLTIDADVAAKTLTIDHTLNATYPQFEGVELTINHTGSENFTLACDDGSIDGTTAIVAGNRYVYYVDDDSNLVMK